MKQPVIKSLDNGSTPGGRTVWWWLALAAVVVGVVLRLWQWGLRTTFFMDELAVIHNLSRSVGHLVGAPLAEEQVAPPLFLLVEKGFLLVFGPSELSLRFPALLASIAALLLLWAVAKRVLDERLVPLALLTFAVGFTFVYYSNQVKQYASDVTVGLLVVWLALRLRDTPLPTPRFWVAAALAGLILPFYSQASLMFFAGCGAMLVLLAYFDPSRPRLRATLAVVSTWAAGSILSLAAAQRAMLPVVQNFMHYFWREGMLPLNAHLPRVFFGTIAERWANGLGWPHPTSIWIVVTLLGAGLLWRRHREATLLLVAPWLPSIAAAALQQFPLRQRLMDFLMPSLILFVFAAFQAVMRWAWHQNPRLGGATLALCGVPILYSMTRHNLPPYCMEDAKTLYEQLARVRRPTDAVYAYYGNGQYLRWYGPQYGFSPTTYSLGHCYRHFPGAERNYLKEVDAFRGRRLWLVMMHFDPYEEQDLRAYLSSIGRPGPRITIHSPMPDEAVGYFTAYAQFYDLTDVPRAAGFSAATFPLAPTPKRPANEICWSCYGPQVISN